MPEPDFTGDIEFSYFAYDCPGAYAQMGRARLSYENAQGAPSLVNDRFLLLEDTALAISGARAACVWTRTERSSSSLMPTILVGQRVLPIRQEAPAA